MPEASYNDLARKYGLDPIPDSVQRLTGMVASQDSDLDEISTLIDRDPGLKKRLLRLANPSALKEEDYELDTVESALFRQGIGAALLLAMGTPLAFALAKTFQTMLGIKLESVDARTLKPIDPPWVLGTIGFSGKAAGTVCVRLAASSATVIAATIFGMDPKELTNPTEINDAVGELCNIITGNFKSNLCDAGLDCKLEPPKVWRTSEAYTVVVPGGGLERMGFKAGNLVVLVDVGVNPWNQED
jgi:CheY-specific phosphatase CheX